MHGCTVAHIREGERERERERDLQRKKRQEEEGRREGNWEWREGIGFTEGCNYGSSHSALPNQWGDHENTSHMTFQLQ